MDNWLTWGGLLIPVAVALWKFLRRELDPDPYPHWREHRGRARGASPEKP